MYALYRCSNGICVDDNLLELSFTLNTIDCDNLTPNILFQEWIMQAELLTQITAPVGSQFADSIFNLLSNYDITRKTAPIPSTNTQLLNLFLCAKTIESKSPKTMMYYKNTLTQLLTTTKKTIKQTTTNDLINYLSDFQTFRIRMGEATSLLITSGVFYQAFFLA